MPWYFPWSESIKKRACRYLLQHYLGDFLKEKLDLDQLTVDLYHGKGTVTNIPLDVWALNEMMSNAGIPLEMVDGFISSISVSVPWKALLNDSCEIEIHGLQLTFTPKQKVEEGSMLDSTYSWNSMSMTTSIQLAQECLRQEAATSGDEHSDAGQSFEGLEAFAQTIESVLARVRLSFADILVRMEHIPMDSKTGVGIELHIDCMDYWDLSHEEIGQENAPQHSVYEPVAVAIKNFQMKGINLFIDEFPKHKRTRLREVLSDENLDECRIDQFSHVGEDFYKYSTKQRKESEKDDMPGLLQKVKILSSYGKQNVKVKLKQSEALPGPKVDIDYSLAGLNIFLTPRQLHLLVDAVSAIPEAGPPQGEVSDSAGSSRRTRMREMKSEDYMKVEESLQSQFHGAETQNWKQALNSLQSDVTTTNSLANHSTASEEEFFSMSEFPLPALGQPTLLNAVKQHNLSFNVNDPNSFSPTSPRSTLSNISLGGSSSSLSTKGTLTERASTVFRASSVGSSGSRFTHGFSSPPTNVGLAGISTLDDSMDTTHVKLRSSNIVFILLHRDPLISKHEVSDSSMEYCLEEMSSLFFSHMEKFTMHSLFGLSGEDFRDSLLTTCCYDHIRILASAVTLEMEQKIISGSKSLTTDMIVGKLAVDENLYDTVNKIEKKTKIPYSQTKLLQFKLQEDSPLYPGMFGASLSPCVKVKMFKTQRAGSAGVQSRSTLPPKSSVTVELGVLDAEIDLTMVDRVVALLQPGPFYKMNNTKHTNINNMYASLATGHSANQQTAFRQVMDDSPMIGEYKTDFSVQCSDATLLIRFPVPDLRPSSDINKRPWWHKAVHKENLKVDISSFELKTSLHAIQTSFTYDMTFKKAKAFFLAQGNYYHLFDIGMEDGDKNSMGIDMPRILITSCQPVNSVFENDMSKDSSPDSIESEYPWMKSEPSPFATQQTMYENEEMVLPGSVAEMNAFQEFATMNSKYSINCYVPYVQMNLHTNDIFELVYNRFFGDLMMWESLAPSPVDFNTKQMNPYESVHINLASHIGQLDNGGDKFFMCRSAIRDAFDSHSNDTSFFSADYTDSPQRQHEQTNLCFSLHIDKGEIALFPPAKDSSSDMSSSTPTDTSCTNVNAIKEVGHVVLNVKNGHFFMASGYKGQSNTDFMELYSNEVELFHSNYVNDSIDINIMADALNTSVLLNTIHPSDDNVRSKCKGAMDVGTENLAMLSLAMKSTSQPSSKTKDNKLAVALRGGTLNHVIKPSGQSWLLQLINFMSIEDYPILGYTFPSTITGLHLHLWGCAVDYRPINIPVHSLLTVEMFSLSSNLIPMSKTSILRFLIEDSTFYICDKITDDVNTSSYIPVMDMAMFELTLKLTDGLDTRQPVFDLAMSNNMLNIRTCSDSCVALMKLIKYFASDGDLQLDGCVSDTTSERDAELDTTLPSTPVIDGQTMDSNHIDVLMADAMLDDNDDKVDGKFEGTLIDECFDDIEEDDPSSSDEYCFLDNDTPKQNSDKHDPIARMLTDKKINIIDGYFQIPLGKQDLLGSPDDYPPAVCRYTIREMSLVWQMYGGNDFQTTRSRRTSSTSSPTISSSRKSSLSSQRATSPSKGDTKYKVHRVKGGVNRDVNTLMELQMNKIRFQHEVYPENSKQVYRDVLLIYDLEIRDRLVSSQLNKFLYCFSSENLPKQSSANMVTIKLLVSKPEDEARSEEASLRVSLQPLRLNVDQESLFFLKDFFAEISGSKPTPKPVNPDLSTCLSSSPGREPFQTISDSPVMSSPVKNEMLKHLSSSESLKSEKSSALFIKSFVFSPEVPIRLDYQGKYIAIEQGTLAGLIIGLSQLNCSELRLKRLCCRSGLLGVDKLISYILQEWLNDIRRNQLRSILGGVGPTYSLLQLFQGVKDLFWMPVQQYRQDGRIVRGLQRGAHSFSTSTAMAMLELSNRLVTTIQSFAELTFDMVSPGPSHVSALQTRSSGQVAQPAEMREGLVNAYTVLTEGFSQTASNIVRVATEEHEKKGMTGAVGGVLRQIPPTVVKPLILATEATSNVLGGAMNQLAPDKRKEALEKWRTENS